MKVLAASLILCGALLRAGVTTPITATIVTTTYTVDEDGNAKLDHQSTGLFARAGDGTEIRIDYTGTHQPMTAVLNMDYQNIIIKYFTKQYTIFEGRGSDGVVRKIAPYNAPPLAVKPGQETRTINGLFTAAVPNYDGNTKQLAGQTWISPEYKIPVLSEFESVFNGRRVRHVTEYTNIIMGVEPDPSIFCVPAGFKNTGSIALSPNVPVK
ncbi:MAG: hypothetical protein JO323_23320 [Acidobacteriia bacterium]|nr:hypothetical protein [Terriglobia bacterium]